MRTISVEQVRQAVKELCISANVHLPQDVKESMQQSIQNEISPLGREVLCDLCENFLQAEQLNIPVCQDTGMAVVFIEMGQEVLFVGGDLNDAVNQGVREGYLEGRLRCSIVKDPLRRENTNDNTPAILHLCMVPGDKVKITVAPKGFGSENMSKSRMFTPSATQEDIIRFVTECVDTAGSNPCPPVIVGVGIGGDFEYCAYLSKKALVRENPDNPDPFYCKMEQQMLERINRTGIGPQGFGGSVTALKVNIEAYPTHIAGLPVCVNMGCHVTRHQHTVL